MKEKPDTGARKDRANTVDLKPGHINTCKYITNHEFKHNFHISDLQAYVPYAANSAGKFEQIVQRGKDVHETMSLIK